MWNKVAEPPSLLYLHFYTLPAVLVVPMGSQPLTVLSPLSSFLGSVEPDCMAYSCLSNHLQVNLQQVDVLVRGHVYGFRLPNGSIDLLDMHYKHIFMVSDLFYPILLTSSSGTHSIMMDNYPYLTVTIYNVVITVLQSHNS